jgi:hypothetical protein
LAIGLVTIGLAACEGPPGTRGSRGQKGDKGDPGSKLRIVTGGAIPLAVTGNQAQCGANPESPDFKIRLVCMKR